VSYAIEIPRLAFDNVLLEMGLAGYSVTNNDVLAQAFAVCGTTIIQLLPRRAEAWWNLCPLSILCLRIPPS
jgi:hypothetical protein